MVVKKKDLIQALGIGGLFCYFFLFTVGNIWGLSSWCSYLFALVVVIVFLMLPKDTSVLKQYRQYYLWQSVFIIFVFMSCLWTINTEHAFSLAMNIVKILFKVSAVAIICNDFAGLKKLLIVFDLLGGVTFVSLYFTGNLYESFRLGTELLGNANSFGLIITIFLVGAMYYSLNSKNKIFKYLSIACIMCDIYMIFLSGGRKFLLFAIVFMYVSFLLNNSGRLKISSIVAGTLLIVGIIGIGYYAIIKVPVLYDAIGIRFVGLNTAQGALGVDSQSRLMMRGIEMFAKKPIFGWGVGGFQQYSYMNYGSYIYGHSNYLELLANFGLVGTALYIGQYVYCLKNILKLNKNLDIQEYKLFLPLLVAILVIDIFAISFNQTAFIPLFVMFISGYVSRLKNSRYGEM